MDEALLDFEKCVAQSPNDPASFIGRGGAWFAKEEYEKAAADYSEAIKLLPNDPRPLTQRGYARAAMNKADQALVDFDAALELSAKELPALFGRAEVRRVQKKYDEAIPDFTAILKQDPNELRALMSRAACYYGAGKPESALADFASTIAAHPDFAQGYNDYAWLLATGVDDKYRDGKKAVELACQACNLTEWKNAGYLDTLAAAYAESGDFASAQKWQEAALAASESEAQDVKDEIQGRVSLYKTGKPYREAAK